MDRKHAKEIRLWLDNPNAVVWCHSNKAWWVDHNPTWSSRYRYRVILPEYKEAWQAYLDGELETLSYGFTDRWRSWTSEPKLLREPNCYRRKPKKNEVTITIDSPLFGEKTTITGKVLDSCSDITEREFLSPSGDMHLTLSLRQVTVTRG